MIDGQRFVETGRRYRGTLWGYCRACREQETLERFSVTVTDQLTGDTETRQVKVCMGCSHESEQP